MNSGASPPVDLASNTNLFGRPPALDTPLPDATQYPDATASGFREAAAAAYGVAPEHVVAGAGSDQLIDLVMRARLEVGGTVSFVAPTFSMVPLFASYNRGEPVAVPTEDGRLPVDELALADIAYVCRPNNPTGTVCARKELEDLITRSRGTVLVDEAYVEFDGDSVAPLIGEGTDLVVLRTMSKAHGLAGLRVGCGLMEPELAKRVEAIGGPYRVNVWSEAVAVAALQDQRFMRRSVAATRAERDRWHAALSQRGFAVTPSHANFLWTRPEIDAHALADALERNGFRVRTFRDDRQHMRITVAPEQVRIGFLAAADQILETA